MFIIEVQWKPKEVNRLVCMKIFVDTFEGLRDYFLAKYYFIIQFYYH